jgi:hypothetical protein
VSIATGEEENTDTNTITYHLVKDFSYLNSDCHGGARALLNGFLRCKELSYRSANNTGLLFTTPHGKSRERILMYNKKTTFQSNE